MIRRDETNKNMKREHSLVSSSVRTKDHCSQVIVLLGERLETPDRPPVSTNTCSPTLLALLVVTLVDT